MRQHDATGSVRRRRRAGSEPRDCTQRRRDGFAGRWRWPSTPEGSVRSVRSARVPLPSWGSRVRAVGRAAESVGGCGLLSRCLRWPSHACPTALDPGCRYHRRRPLIKAGDSESTGPEPARATGIRRFPASAVPTDTRTPRRHRSDLGCDHRRALRRPRRMLAGR